MCRRRADTSLLGALTGYKPSTDISEGVQEFVNWYRNYYNILVNNIMRNDESRISSCRFCTRFLPATKAMPKEIMPIIDKPLIQYAVEEAIEAGIKT